MAGLTLSAFDVIGPVMIGPSSSHTAGAARIGRAARQLLGELPQRAAFELHGSFAATGRGHATDRALLGGVLGDAPDDEALPRSAARATALGIEVSFSSIDLGDEAHPNTAVVRLASAARDVRMVGVSLGGGLVKIVQIDRYPVSLSGQHPALICWHRDVPGFLADLTAMIARRGINLSAASNTRDFRGGSALSVLESDAPLPAAVAREVRELEGLDRLCEFAPLP